jgi:integrase
MVDAAGQRWHYGWVRGEGFVRPSGGDPMRRPPRFDGIGEEYVRQIVDLSAGQRKRYLGQLRVLAATRVQGELVFTKPVTSITEADLRAWLLTWGRSVKTKSNYHGLIHGVFAYAIAQGWLTVSPTVRTALKGSRVRQSRPELRFLTEVECEAAVKTALKGSRVRQSRPELRFLTEVECEAAVKTAGARRTAT